MLHKDTLLSTDYGVFKIQNLPVAISVPTTEGWCKIVGVWGSLAFKRKFKIETSIGSVIFDERQHFFQDSKRINPLRLHTGSFIDTFYGSKEIIKMTQFVDKYGKYYGLRVNNFNSNFYIHNGILLSY